MSCRSPAKSLSSHLPSLMGCFGWVSYLQSYKLVRGASDLGGVANRVTARSRYGGKRPIFWLFLSSESRKSLIVIVSLSSEETEVMKFFSGISYCMGPVPSHLIKTSAVSVYQTSPRTSYVTISMAPASYLLDPPSVIPGPSIQKYFLAV